MTPQQRSLVQRSWRRVAPISETAARLTYRRLFERIPAARDGVGMSVSELGDHLVASLTATLAGDGCGVDFGVSDLYLDAARDAFCWMLKQVDGAQSTAEVQDAWRALLAEAPALATA